MDKKLENIRTRHLLREGKEWDFDRRGVMEAENIPDDVVEKCIEVLVDSGDRVATWLGNKFGFYDKDTHEPWTQEDDERLKFFKFIVGRFDVKDTTGGILASKGQVFSWAKGVARDRDQIDKDIATLLEIVDMLEDYNEQRGVS
jgi:hypothetical protein